MIEQTLAIIKPDGMKNLVEIIERINNSGLKIVALDFCELNEDILREHYVHLIDKPFYKDLEKYMMEDYVVVLVLEGENAVLRLRDLMGPTDSKKAPAGTIRGDFGTDITRNAIHGSDSVENAKIEINRFFRSGKVKKLTK